MANAPDTSSSKSHAGKRKKRSHKEEGTSLFHKINEMTRESAGLQQDFWAALRQDFPDLDAIFEAEGKKEQPSDGYLRLVRALDIEVHGGEAGAGLSNTVRTDFIQGNIPYQTSGRWLEAGRLSSGYLPQASTMTHSAFQAVLSSSNAQDRATLMLADVLYSAGKMNSAQRATLLDPEVCARIDALIGIVGDRTDLVATAFINQGFDGRHQTTSEIKAVYGKMAEKDPIWQKLLALFENHIIPATEAALSSDNNKEHRSRSEGADDTVFLPENGAVKMLTSAHWKLKQLLYPDRVTVDILENPALRDAVRNTSNQDAFMGACAKMDGFKLAVKAKDASAEAQVEPDTAPTQKAKRPEGNALLAGLDEVAAPAAPKHKASVGWDAAVGYFDTITTGDDLAAVAGAWPRDKHGGWLDVEAGSPYADLVAKTAERVNFSIKDAFRMIDSDFAYKLDRSVSPVILDALNGGRWDAKTLDAFLTERPHPNNTRISWQIAESVFRSNPGAISELSDRGAFQLARTWILSDNRTNRAYSQTDAITEAFKKRLQTLPQDNKAFLLSRWRGFHHSRDSSAQERSRDLVRSLLGSAPSEEVGALISEAYLFNPIHHFYSDLAAISPDSVPQEKVIEELNAMQRIGDQDIPTAKLLLGYDSSFDKSKTLDGLSFEKQRDLFVHLARRIATDERPMYPHHPYANAHREPVDVQGKNIDRNMAFDLHEHFSSQNLPPVTLIARDQLVRQGIAQAGDQLTWDGFVHLVAPFLEGERPVIEPKVEAAAGQTSAPVGARVLDKNALAQSMAERTQSRHHGTMHGMGHMHPRMREMLEDGRGAFTHPIAQMMGAAMQYRTRFQLAEDCLGNLAGGRWFAPPKPEATQEVADPENKDAAGPQRSIKM